MTGKNCREASTEPALHTVPRTDISLETLKAALAAYREEAFAHSAITLIHPRWGVVKIPAKNEHLLVSADGE